MQGNFPGEKGYIGARNVTHTARVQRAQISCPQLTVLAFRPNNAVMKPGTVIAGKYRLVNRLGDGAMGSVWEAVNELTQRSFAIKLIHRMAVGGDELRARMMREARAAGRLHHRNVIEVYDVGETAEGDPFLVMELLRGETMEALLQRKGQLSVSLTCAIGVEVSRGLASAHDAGIIHRDLKPANIFLHHDADRGVVVKVLDFGVSKVVSDQNASVTTTGTAIGSPAYMSPEQAVGAPDIDARSDLWSVGVLLLEAASGTPAFDGDTVYAIVGNILHGEVPRLAGRAPNADARLDGIIARCLLRDRGARFETARELAAQLETLLPASAEAVLEDLEEEPTLAREGPSDVRPGQDSVIATKAYVRPLHPDASEAAPVVTAGLQRQPDEFLELPPGSVTTRGTLGGSKLPIPLIVGVLAMGLTGVIAIVLMISFSSSSNAEPTATPTAPPVPVATTGSPPKAASLPVPTASVVTPAAASADAAPSASSPPTVVPPPPKHKPRWQPPTPKPSAKCPPNLVYIDPATGQLKCHR